LSFWAWFKQLSLLQSIPGEDDFVEGLISHIKKHQDIPEIPKSHRYVNRPSLDKIFPKNVILDNKKRDKKIIDAVQKPSLLYYKVLFSLHYDLCCHGFVLKEDSLFSVDLDVRHGRRYILKVD
jgi:hypothetical protein